MVIEENVKSASFDPSEDYEYTIQARRRYKEDRRPFSMIGPIKNKKSRRHAMDIFKKLISVSRAAEIVFNDLMNNMDPDFNTVTMEEWGELGASKMRSVYRRLVELKEAELILDVKPVEGKIHKPPKFTYMINPYYIKPWEYARAKRAWSLLGGKPV